MEALLDDCCAKDLASSEGLGCDNITAIIVEIAHWKQGNLKFWGPLKTSKSEHKLLSSASN